MKLCITSKEDNIDSDLDPRFGRCQYFIIKDTENDNYEIIKNNNIDATGGAGIQSAQLIVSKQVNTLLTGKVGPNALRVLDSAGVKIISDVSGSVKEVIENFDKGLLK